jgi:hypothetical protein
METKTGPQHVTLCAVDTERFYEVRDCSELERLARKKEALEKY